MTDPAGPLGPYVDLHAHTTASDGRATPEELVAAALAAGLSAVAVTDHDTLDGIARAVAAAAPHGLEVVPGIELSTMDGTREVHLLGLLLSDTAGLQQRLVAVLADRIDRAQAMVQRLAALGLPIPMEAVLAQAGDGAVGRPHVARALVAAGHVRDVREAFDKWLGDGRPANVGKTRLELADGIALVHAAGGVALWAHPGSEGSRDRIERMRAMGLDGVEVRHPSHNSEDIARLSTIADFFGMLKSGGADWHGSTDGFRPLGCMQVPAPWLDAMRPRAIVR